VGLKALRGLHYASITNYKCTEDRRELGLPVLVGVSRRCLDAS
jgi:hypothetical protein